MNYIPIAELKAAFPQYDAHLLDRAMCASDEDLVELADELGISNSFRRSIVHMVKHQPLVVRETILENELPGEGLTLKKGDSYLEFFCVTNPWDNALLLSELGWSIACPNDCMQDGWKDVTDLS